MNTDAHATESTPTEDTFPEENNETTPVAWRSKAKLIQLKKQQKGVIKQNFEFRNTRKRTSVPTKVMADFQEVKALFENNSLPYFIFYPKSEKPLKAVTCLIPFNTPTEESRCAAGPWLSRR
jgi:hypothetical protein